MGILEGWAYSVTTKARMMDDSRGGECAMGERTERASQRGAKAYGVGLDPPYWSPDKRGAITFGLLFFPKPVRLTPRGRRLPLEHPPHTEVNESKS